MSLIQLPKSGRVVVTSLTNPTVVITGPDSDTDPGHTLIVRSFTVENIDNAATPVVSVGRESSATTPIVDADAKHFYAHREDVVDRLPLDIDHLLATSNPERIFIVADTPNAVAVRWWGFEVYYSPTEP